MPSDMPAFIIDGNGQFPCPSVLCEGRLPFHSLKEAQDHWNNVHTINTTKHMATTAEVSDTRRQKQREYARAHYYKMKALKQTQANNPPDASNSEPKAKTKVKKTRVAPVPATGGVDIRIFSYFCPGCGSSQATFKSVDVCDTCHLPQGPVLMGLRLAVKQMGNVS